MQFSIKIQWLGKTILLLVGAFIGYAFHALFAQINWTWFADSLSQLDANTWIAISSVFIALLALFITIWQTHVARKHNRLSVMPHLDYIFVAVPGKPIELRIINNGLGPAIISFFEFKYGEKLYTVSPITAPSVFRDVLEPLNVKCEWFVPTLGTSIIPNSPLCLVAVDVPIDNVQLHNRVVSEIHSVQFRIDYHSIYRQPLILTYTLPHEQLNFFSKKL